MNGPNKVKPQSFSSRPTIRLPRQAVSAVEVSRQNREAKRLERHRLQANVDKFYGPGKQLLDNLDSPNIFWLYFASLFIDVFDGAALSFTGRHGHHPDGFINRLAILAADRLQLIYVPSRTTTDICSSGTTGLDRHTISYHNPEDLGIDPGEMPAQLSVMGRLQIYSARVESVVALPIAMLVQGAGSSVLCRCHGVFIITSQEPNAFDRASHIEVMNQIGLEAGRIVESKPEKLGNLLAPLKLVDEQTSATGTRAEPVVFSIF